MKYAASLFIRKSKPKGSRRFHKRCKCARNLPVFEQEAWTFTVLSEAPSVAASAAKWEIRAGLKHCIYLDAPCSQ